MINSLFVPTLRQNQYESILVHEIIHSKLLREHCIMEDKVYTYTMKIDTITTICGISN